MQPTSETYSELQTAYDWFNDHLFDSSLPPCLITLQRNKKSFGFFCWKRFGNKLGEKVDEIAMNPAFFAVRPIEDTLSTLVHEMVHLLQAYKLNPGRRGYHNKEWSNLMRAIGLIPSNNGQPGGQDTGERMSHYIEPNGKFINCCNDLLKTDFAITWYDRFPPFSPKNTFSRNPDQPGQLGDLQLSVNKQLIENLDKLDIIEPVELDKSNRHKYICPSCGLKAWGKPGINLMCGDCVVRLETVQR